jgi:hypothetical protein
MSCLNFELVSLDPGERKQIEAVPLCAFRAQKLVMVGYMDVIRGQFKIRHSRLPLLDRDDVTAYSTPVYGRQRWSAKKREALRKTVVQFTHPTKGTVTRTYRASNVVYIHTDPLSYVRLEDLSVDSAPTMPNGSVVGAQFFGAQVLGNGLRMPTSQKCVKITLSNHGDVQVRVFATIFGVSR